MSSASLAVPLERPIDYPESDGQPVAETDAHVRELLGALGTLSLYFRDDPNVYVAGNLFLYYIEGDPSARVAPDVFVVKGVPKRLRRTYKLWEEGRAPDVVIEFSSRSTRLEDLGNKRVLYAMLGVGEYFLFDPLEEYLEPSLRGYRLEGRDYEPIRPGLDGSLKSEALDLRLSREGIRLRFTEMATGEPLPFLEELPEKLRAEVASRLHAEEHARRAEEHARRAEEQACRAEERRRAEEELRRTEEELRRAAEERVRNERNQRQEAERQAQEARRRAAEAEAEVARLRARLTTPQGDSPAERG